LEVAFPEGLWNDHLRDDESPLRRQRGLIRRLLDGRIVTIAEPILGMRFERLSFRHRPSYVQMRSGFSRLRRRSVVPR
jgi:hypothetical protein